MTPMITFTNFTKQYGNFTAVSDMNLTINAGTITGFVGKNGAGKSTTIRAMMNILFPTAGTITIDGLDSAKDAKKIQAMVSYMPSDAALYDKLTAQEFLSFCASLTTDIAEEYTDLARYFELDLTKKIGSLSLGNRKKVSMIQALLKNSKLFILDEPTSGLDPLMQERFFEKLLERKAKGSTIFLSSHNLTEIEKYCDEAVIIKDGMIVEQLELKTAMAQRKQLVHYTTATGEVVQYTYDGTINELIAALAKQDIAQLEIRQASIEETFIHFYKEASDET